MHPIFFFFTFANNFFALICISFFFEMLIRRVVRGKHDKLYRCSQIDQRTKNSFNSSTRIKSFSKYLNERKNAVRFYYNAKNKQHHDTIEHICKFRNVLFILAEKNLNTTSCIKCLVNTVYQVLNQFTKALLCSSI